MEHLLWEDRGDQSGILTDERSSEIAARGFGKIVDWFNNGTSVIAGGESAIICQTLGIQYHPVIFSADDWGVQSPPKLIVFRLHCHSQKVIDWTPRETVHPRSLTAKALKNG